jgi:hypothetical protein
MSVKLVFITQATEDVISSSLTKHCVFGYCFHLNKVISFFHRPKVIPFGKKKLSLQPKKKIFVCPISES